jgi:hypothetical protein
MGCFGKRAFDLPAVKALMANSNHFFEAPKTLKPFTCALFIKIWAIFYLLDREKSLNNQRLKSSFLDHASSASAIRPLPLSICGCVDVKEI